MKENAVTGPPTPCPKHGGERHWGRSGVRNGTVLLKAVCRNCHRESLARQREKHGGAAARNKTWEQKNPEKARAHKLVEHHLRAGNIVRRPCVVCGDQNSHAHHDDYSVPLEVTWLCPKHHAERHHCELTTFAGDSSPPADKAGALGRPPAALSVPANLIKTWSYWTPPRPDDFRHFNAGRKAGR